MYQVTSPLSDNATSDNLYSDFQVEQEPSTTSLKKTDVLRVSTRATSFVKLQQICFTLWTPYALVFLTIFESKTHKDLVM
jgi:hypothetical protein